MRLVNRSPLRVSVALCTYRSEAYLRAQLTSILDQELPVHEVVVSDDGSDDGTLGLVAEIMATHPHGNVVRVAHSHRAGGVVRNFARAIASCEGDVIALSDHDDVWLPHKTATLLSTMQDKGASLAFSDAHIIDAEGARTGATLFAAYGVEETELEMIDRGRALEVLQRRNIVTGATVMVTRDLALRALPVGTSWVHDEWLAIVAAACATVAVERDPLLEYRVHDANQIGVPARGAISGFLYELRAGSARYKMHRDRTLSLLRALEDTGAPGPSIEAVRSQLDFDNARLHYPILPLTRGRGIRQQARARSYQRFSLHPARERWRDMLQRP